MRDCGSVAPSGHRSLHLPASRGGFQEMPQVVAVREIPPDYNQRLYKDAAQCLYTAHWSTSVLSVKKKCRSVPLRLHLFILLVTIPVRCGPGPCEWSLWLWSDVVHHWQKQAMWSSNTTAQSSMHLMFYLNTVWYLICQLWCVVDLALFDISIWHIDCRYIDTFEKYRYRYRYRYRYGHIWKYRYRYRYR